ncbi:glycoside hydrolase family 15 protein [Reichenbachiella ulvae]|uniref:Glycoside hydrolase family 15 protein n=1 Tax=Reichenbachiella ulvae TaxID=2980104 RepID=A0ABT3CXX1_9BACT|nr:glycoside hydrolase family 15 protein [Reichenbachiella ulvae]MCV9388384.1 glycoside hydrolase family 15 protein [Reichenbachiella ulvae]
MSRHTYDFGVIGNCAFSAHIKTDTNIAWMCWPRFDSSFIFGKMVDEEKGGEYSVLPAEGEFNTKQYYVENTNVLCTEIECSDGAKYKVTDFAPRFEQYERHYKPLMLIRKIEPINGHATIKVNCNPVGDYGKNIPEKSIGSNHIRYIGLDAQVRLTTNISMNYIINDQEFVLNETKYCVLTYGQPMEAELKETCETFLSRTVRYWRNWVKTASINHFQQKAAIRSALILKIHQYEDTGAIVAALTTSLPEAPKSTRNWDYRFCWMRDTYYTLNAFNNIGHFEELEQYFHYIMNITSAETERYQPLVGIGGEKKLIEIESDLSGYQGENRPVRIGNQAYEHIQNDVYGQVLVSLLPLYYDQRIIFTEKFDSGDLIFKTLGLIEKTMEQKDAGLWEFRNLQQYHCYTYLFHWAGCLAAKKIAAVIKDEEMDKLATRLGKIAQEKIEKCYSPEKKGYSQAIGTDRMDASCLQLINMGYLDPKSDRAKEHLIAMERDLKASNGLFYRYKHQDDFGEPETTFMICAFWYVEALACVGRVDEAIQYFEHLVSQSNHVGLLSEDVNEHDGSMWGNFPQAYSHVGLLNAAERIARKLDIADFNY